MHLDRSGLILNPKNNDGYRHANITKKTFVLRIHSREVQARGNKLACGHLARAGPSNASGGEARWKALSTNSSSIDGIIENLVMSSFRLLDYARL